MADKFRWGIMGTGNIARQFTTGMATTRRGVVSAVGSRAMAPAAAFASDFKIPQAYASYEELLADRNIDGIYLSLPNSLHHEWTIKALNAGKHVLCEKPIANNAFQAEEMFDIAKKRGKLLVEAFMYRAHPQTRSYIQTLRSGTIGDVKLIKTSFCYRTTKIANNIRFDPALAGGAVMDIGCYCVNFARMIGGRAPVSVLATGRLHQTGVDEYASGSINFGNGILASFVCGMTVQADNSAYVCGSEGYLEIPWPWKPLRKATYTISHSAPPKQDVTPGATPQQSPRQDVSVEAEAELYALEADDFAATVLDGAAPMMTPEETIDNMVTLDEIRRQIGLNY